MPFELPVGVPGSVSQREGESEKESDREKESTKEREKGGSIEGVSRQMDDEERRQSTSNCHLRSAPSLKSLPACLRLFLQSYRVRHL